MRDLLTVIRKEWIEILDQFIHFKRGGWSILVVLLFLGVIVPLQMGPTWVSSALMFFYWPFLTSSMTSTIVADAIAGERERHTLETLLATPLSDSAILLGKLIGAVLYGYAFAVSNIAIGAATMLVRYGSAAELMPVGRFLALLALIGSAASAIAGLGVFVSLKAPTVRQAQQTFGIVLLVIMLLPVLATQLLSASTRARVGQYLATLGLESVVWRASGLLAVASVLLLGIALARFKRGDISLD